MNLTKLIGVFAVLLATGLLSGGRASSPTSPLQARVPADTGRSRADPRAVIFLRRGCAECHTISALGVTAAREVGPDLTFAYADVVNRYGVTLETFLYDPTGVMRLTLASHLHLNWVDRDSMVTILKALYLERRAEMDENVPSFPPGRFRPPRAHVPASPADSAGMER